MNVDSVYLLNYKVPDSSGIPGIVVCFQTPFGAEHTESSEEYDGGGLYEDMVA